MIKLILLSVLLYSVNSLRCSGQTTKEQETQKYREIIQKIGGEDAVLEYDKLLLIEFLIIMMII